MASKTFFTVAESAKQVGVSRQTIFDKIKSGKLSATINNDGVKVVDVSELLRVFGRLLSAEEVKQKELGRAVQATRQQDSGGLQLQLERAQLQLEKKDFELEQLRLRLDELKARESEAKEKERQSTEERQRLLGVIERQTLLLEYAKPKAPRATPAPSPVAQRAKPQAAKVVLTKPKAVVKKAPATPVAKPKAVAKSAPKAKPAAVKKATRK